MKKLFTLLLLSGIISAYTLPSGVCETQIDEIKPLTGAELKEKWNITPKAKKIILDTDLVYFVDDVYALHALLQADRLGYLKLCGITTCCGNSYAAGVTYDTLAYLDYAGCSDIPLYMGSDKLISGEADIAELEKESGKIPYQGFYAYKDRYTDDYRKALENGIAFWPGKPPVSTPQTESAADYIIKEIHRNPGEVTILALGGLTNVAQALRKDPTIAQDAAGIVYMGGVFDVLPDGQKNLEFNFWCDPAATNIALSADWKSQVIIAHDAATTCTKDFDIYQRALRQNHNPFTSMFLDYYNKGCSDQEEVKENFPKKGPLLCWDPITVAYLLCPDICIKEETRYLRVDDRRGPTYGSTLNWKDGMQAENSYPAQVVLAADRERFWDFMFDLFDATKSI